MMARGRWMADMDKAGDERSLRGFTLLSCRRHEVDHAQPFREALGPVGGIGNIRGAQSDAMTAFDVEMGFGRDSSCLQLEKKLKAALDLRAFVIGSVTDEDRRHGLVDVDITAELRGIAGVLNLPRINEGQEVGTT